MYVCKMKNYFKKEKLFKNYYFKKDKNYFKKREQKGFLEVSCPDVHVSLLFVL